MSQLYRIDAIAPSAPNHVVLYQISPDYLRAEPIALHILIEDSATAYDRRSEGYRHRVLRQVLLPVPLSMHKAGLDLGELMAILGDTFWEVRLADTDAILARLADIYPCKPACRWVTTQDADDGAAIDFTLEHGDGCDLAAESEEDEAGPCGS